MQLNLSIRCIYRLLKILNTFYLLVTYFQNVQREFVLSSIQNLKLLWLKNNYLLYTM